MKKGYNLDVTCDLFLSGMKLAVIIIGAIVATAMADHRDGKSIFFLDSKEKLHYCNVSVNLLQRSPKQFCYLK